MKKQIVTGLIGAASLLAMAATGAYADLASVKCTSGFIKTIKAGYVSDVTWAGQCRWLEITCGTAGGDLAGKTGTYCVYNTLDADGVLATALTAQADSKEVAFSIYQDYKPDNTGYDFGNGILLDLSLKTGL